MDFALARVDGSDLRLEVAPVLIGRAHVGEQDIAKLLVDFTSADQFRRPQPDSFLMDVGRFAREACRHGAADIGMVDVVDDEAGDLTVVEDRLPKMDIGRVGCDVTTIRIVGDTDIAVLIVADGIDHAPVVVCSEPHSAKIVGRRKTLAIGRPQDP